MHKGWSPKAQKGLREEQTGERRDGVALFFQRLPKDPFGEGGLSWTPLPQREQNLGLESGKWSQFLPSSREQQDPMSGVWGHIYESTEWGIGRSGLSHPACSQALERPTDSGAKEQGVMRVRRRAFAESSGKIRSRAARMEVREGDVSSNSKNQSVGQESDYYLPELPAYPSPL